MTKKHFEEMASYIRAHKASDGTGDSENAAFIRGMFTMAVHLGRIFGRRFDEDRFENACKQQDAAA